MRWFKQAVPNVLSLVTVLISLVVVGPLAGDTIPGVFSTGMDSNRNPLGAGQVDPHYQLISTPNSWSNTATYVVLPNTVGFSNTYPFQWQADDASSQWIAPDASMSTFGYDETTWIYRLTFDLTGFRAATANIKLLWTCDNDGQQIILNGVNTGLTNNSDSSHLDQAAVSISSGFNPGTNTLDFQIYNGLGFGGLGSNPTGLRVDVLSATAAPVPEPSTFILLFIAAISLLAYRRRRSS